jgi:hypothetical protein
MITKYHLLIIINLLFFIFFQIIYNKTNIKKNYVKWTNFYEKYKFSPFNYIENYLPFSSEYLFSKILSLKQKLSFFIFNTAYSINDFEDDETQLQIFNENKINKTKTIILSESDLKYDNFFNFAIYEINILENSVDEGNKINIIPILEEGLNKNKIIILFIFFVQQLNIFQHLKQNFNLNKIYLLGKNRTNIERIEMVYEMLFNYEDIQEISSLVNQFISYHKDYGFFIFDELKKEKSFKISESERQMINIVINLRNKNYEEYKNLNDFELALFLDIFEKTTRSLNSLGMAESSFKKALNYYKRDYTTLKIGFIALTIFINLMVIINYEEDNKKKRKKYK